MNNRPAVSEDSAASEESKLLGNIPETFLNGNHKGFEIDFFRLLAGFISQL